MHHWHDKRDTIITLNYDTLTERAFQQIVTGESGVVQYKVSPEALYGIEFAPMAGQMGVPDDKTAELLKLHGSVNWFYSGRSAYAGEMIHLQLLPGWTNDFPSHWRKRRFSGRVPLIVPPLADKVGYFENEEMRGIWQRAASALANAERVFCIGYSFPETDLTIQFLLQHACEVGSDEEAMKSGVECFPVTPCERAAERFDKVRPVSYRINNQFVRPNPVLALEAALTSGELGAPNSASKSATSRSLVKERVRQSVHVGLEIEAWPFRKQQKGEKVRISRMDDSGLKIEVGPAAIPAHFDWECLEGIPQWVASEYSKLPQNDYVQLMGVSGDYPNAPSLHGYLSRWYWRATARQIAAVLQYADILRITERYAQDQIDLPDHPAS